MEKRNNNKLVSFKQIDKNGNIVSLIMIALVIVLVLSSISIILGVKSLLSEEKSSTLDFGDAHFISDIGIVKDEIVIETGSELPELKDYFINEDDVPKTATIRYSDAYQVYNVEDFTTGINGKSYVKGVQDLYVYIICDDKEYESILRIVDNVKPEVTLKNNMVAIDDYILANDFIESYNDNSLVHNYTAFITNSVSTQVAGTYDVTIEVCDLGGNCVKDVTKLIVEDKIIDNLNSEDTEN